MMTESKMFEDGGGKSSIDWRMNFLSFGGLLNCISVDLHEY